MRLLTAFLALAPMSLTAAPQEAIPGCEEPASVRRGLVAATQTLLDAVGAGDRALWARYLADDAFIAAVLSYRVAEELTVFGQDLSTTFQTTDTWVRREGRWRLQASQVTALPLEPQPVAVDAEVLQRYVGTFALAPEVTMTVSLRDGHLFVRRSGGEEQELVPFAENRFFRRGRPDEIRFVESPDRGVLLLTIRRGNALRWRRTP